MVKFKPLLRRLVKSVLRAKDYTRFDGSILPAPDQRYCGPQFKNDAYYLQSAEAEARRLVTRFGCTPASHVLDVGCGQGRLAIGLLRVVGELTYTGIDIDQASIAWCQRRISTQCRGYHFIHLDIANARYNQAGKALNERFHFDLPAQSCDIVYLFSVFSHMAEADMRIYLADFQRVLKPGGGLFFTTFVEEGTPAVSINPEGYFPQKYSGPLHVVRYEKGYLFSVVQQAGFSLTDFTHRTEVDGQSALYLSRL